MSDHLKVALAQIAPAWLNKASTLGKVAKCIEEAADNAAELVVFGEALVPGYPFWVEQTNGAVFESEVQKKIYGHYVHQAVDIEGGELQDICDLAKSKSIAVYLGVIEKSRKRGNSLYCTLVFINRAGLIKSTHRKIMPTYEERLVWSVGDGHGLITHDLGPFKVGGLNCWENWLPLARATFHAQGEDLHVSVWPGNLRNTQELVPMIAKESRSYVLAVGGLFSADDLSDDLPHIALMRSSIKGVLANGGSCIANPDGTWLIEPIVGEEGLFYATLDHKYVREERLSLNISGHYSRPDIFQLTVNRDRQEINKEGQ